MSRLLPLLLALACTFTACGEASVDDSLASLQSTYDSGDYAAVIDQAPALAKRAGAEGASGSTVWRIEKLHLQALAKEGRGVDAAEQLEALASAHEDKVDAQLYQMLGQSVTDAGAASEAVMLLQKAIERFPESKAFFDPQIEQLKSMDLDDAAMAALEQLGYV